MSDSASENHIVEVALIITGFYLLVLGAWFYWYEYRPTMIVSYCQEEAVSTSIGSTAKLKIDKYHDCLRENGIHI